MVGAPSVGDCFDLTYRQALRNSTTERRWTLAPATTRWW